MIFPKPTTGNKSVNAARYKLTAANIAFHSQTLACRQACTPTHKYNSQLHTVTFTNTCGHFLIQGHTLRHQVLIYTQWKDIHEKGLQSVIFN